MTRTPSLKMRLRRARIKRFIAKGLSYDEIAQKEKINIMTVNSDVAVIKNSLRDHITDKNFGDFLIEISENQKMSLGKLWELHNETEIDHVKVSCITQINKILETNVKILQSLGLIERVAEKISVDSAVITGKDFKDFYEEYQSKNGNSEPERIPEESD